MSLDELLNQKPKRLLSRGRSFYSSKSFASLIDTRMMYNLGVVSQEEKDMLEGYLLVIVKKNKVYIADEYQHCSKHLLYK